MPALSRTALLVAAYRARASARPSPICQDPWAEALAGEEGMALAAEQDQWFPHLELWTAVRTAYLDAHVTTWTAPDHGFTQVVLLGAGVDTRAVRLARPGVRFFEVDQPATQAYKRERVAALPGYDAAAATYVSCDFEHDDFVERLIAAGFAVDRPALVLWEGVTPYLTDGAIRATLRRVAGGLEPRSILLFDHLLAARPPTDKEDTREFVGRLGEPVRFGTKDPIPMLAECGFRHVRSLSFDEACLTLTGTYVREREFRFQRMVFATVRPSGTLTLL
jgi:methyltransferase (TIGR00027 family)